MSAYRNRIKTMDYYSPWFSVRNRKFRFRQKRISSERGRQEERVSENFSSVAPSSEDL